MKKKIQDLTQTIQSCDQPLAKADVGICQNCSNLLIDHFDLPLKKTRVNTNIEVIEDREQTPATDKNSKIKPKSAILVKRNANQQSSGFQFGNSSRVNMKTAAALTLFAVIAMACIAGF